MGNVADDIICGFQCSWCGVHFEKEHGYSVACNSCWDRLIKEYGEETSTKTGVQKATFKEL